VAVHLVYVEYHAYSMEWIQLEYHAYSVEWVQLVAQKPQFVNMP
jgi:hypothetical protein